MTPEEEQLLAYIERQQQAGPVRPRGPRIGMSEAALLGGVDGLTLGWGDELVGLASTDLKKKLRERSALAREQQGGAFFGGAVASSFVPGLGILGAAGKVARLGGRLANAGRATTTASRLAEKARFGAGAGATLGGVYGAGAADPLDDTPRKPTDEALARLTGLGGGAAAGAGLGAGFPLLAAAAVRAAPVAAMPVRAAYQALGGKMDTKRAEAAMMDRLKMDFGDADALEAAYWRDRARGGSKPAVIDLKAETVGQDGKKAFAPAENTSRLVEYAAAMPGPGRNLTRIEMERRQAAQLDQVESWIEKKTGGKATFQSTMDELASAQQAESGPLYAAVRNVEIPFTPALRALWDRPDVRTAITNAIRLGKNKGWDLRSMGALADDESVDLFNVGRQGVPGTPGYQPGRMHLGVLDLVKQSLDDAILLSRDPASGYGKNARGALQKTAGEFVDALDEAVAQVGRTGEYRAARDAYAGFAALEDAAELGRKVFSPGAHSDWMAEAGKLSTKSQLEAARAGLRDAMLERAWEGADGRDLYRVLMGNKGARNRIAALFGPLGANGGYPPGARRFFQQVQQEAERVVNLRQVYSRTGSQTAPRQLEADEVDDALGEALVNVMMGDIKGAFLGGLKTTLKGAFGKSPLTPKEAEYVVREGLKPMAAQRPTKANNYQGKPLELAARMRAFDARKPAVSAYRPNASLALSRGVLATN
jgi:hypothetical protein